MPHPFRSLDRRGFLRGAAWTAAGASIAFSPGFSGVARAATRWDRTLVLVHLAGGNDGLNTVIPFGDPAYAQLRPSIGIATSQVVQLTPTIGLHPGLAPLATAWAAGDMAVALGVGYPNPQFSHFRGADIWQTGSASDEYLDTGWAGRLLGGPGGPVALPADTVVVTPGTGAAFQAAGATSVVLPPGGNLGTAAIGQPINPNPANPALAGVLATDAEILTAAASFKQLARITLPVAFPKTAIGNSLAQAARLMMSGVPVPAIAALDGGYDTHTNQVAAQAAKLTDLGNALAAFRQAMIAAGQWDRTLLMTFAEFGRRAHQNGSGGTKNI